MNLKLSKSMSCHLAAKGKWGERAAAWMGLSFFLRMVYYFGFMNMNDVPGWEIAFSVVLPLLISVAFILILKLERLSIPVAAAGLSAAFAVNYFLTEQMNAGGVITGILVLALAGALLAAVLGYLPERKWLLLGAIGVLGARVLFVDLIGYLLPFSELKLIAYVPRASNLFGIAAVCSLCAALELHKAE